MSQNNVGRDSDPPSFTIPIVLNAVALAMIPISQAYFRQIFETQQIELPFQTQITLGVMPLVVLAAVLFLTFVIKRWTKVRLKCVWIPFAVSACGLVVGQHVIGIWLAFLPDGPVDLSF